MISYPSASAVRDGLGPQVCHALSRAVTLTSSDLETYRTTSPDFALHHTARGLANWIHDRLWFHVTALLDEVPSVHIIKNGTAQELIVHDSFRIRMKRHGRTGIVTCYPTQTALDFMRQPEAPLPGLSMTHLTAGYEWDEGSRSIIQPVLSLRDGKDNIIWVTSIMEADLATTPALELPSTIPTGPTITVRSREPGTTGEARNQ